MRIPLNWLSDYLKLNKSPQEIADSFTSLGLMQEKPIEKKVLELEHRMDRSDWLSIIGCARDLAAFENTKLIEPTVPDHPHLVNPNPVKISVSTDTVRRFKTVVIKGVAVKPSPKWLVERLEAYGIESKNNIVDITNYVMLEYGQPMHAQDLAKLPANELTLRDSRPVDHNGVGESITTLLGTEVKLPQGTFIISSGPTICVIGGIVGGATTGVSASTQDIILDAGNYDQSVIRKTSRRLKIINETVSRYDKYLDPRLIDVALPRAIDLILELAGGKVYANGDYYPTPQLPNEMTLTYKRLAQISGMEISPKDVKTRLNNLGYQLLTQDDSSLTLEIPHWRTDVEVEDDLVADILRIGDYNKIPLSPLTTSIPKEITPPLYKFEQKLRELMLSLGAHEQITSPLIKSTKNDQQVKLANSLSANEDALRTTLTQTLSPLLNNYRKHGLEDKLIFEIAKSFESQAHKYQEIRELAAVTLTDPRPYLTSLLSLLSISYTLIPENRELIKIQANGKTLGTLTPHSFTLLTNRLLEEYQPYHNVTTTIPTNTSIDLSLTLPPNTYFANLEKVIRSTNNTLQSIKVLENNQGKNSLLIRLSWDQLDNPDQTRLSLVKALEKIGVKSRSK